MRVARFFGLSEWFVNQLVRFQCVVIRCGLWSCCDCVVESCCKRFLNI